MPIVTNKRVLGLAQSGQRRSRIFSPEDHVKILQAFAAQAALSIHNAQLFLQAQELAALNERHQLARDLHDAVTQTLFSASAVAETLPRVLDQNPDPGSTRQSGTAVTHDTRRTVGNAGAAVGTTPDQHRQYALQYAAAPVVEALQARK